MILPISFLKTVYTDRNVVLVLADDVDRLRMNSAMSMTYHLWFTISQYKYRITALIGHLKSKVIEIPSVFVGITDKLAPNVRSGVLFVP